MTPRGIGGAVTHRFRTYRRIVFILASALPFMLGTPVRAEGDLPVVRLGTQPYPGEAAIFVAQAKNFFAEAGVKVITRQMASGRLTMDAMLSGAIDVATPVETGPMFAIANGTDLAIIAQVSTNPEEVKPLVRADAGVKGPKDLAGKRLGYGAGSSNQFAMYNWLKAGDVPASSVTLVNLQPPDLVAALVNGSIDVGFIWEPFLTKGVEKGGGKIKIIEGQHLYQSRLLLTSRPEWAKEHADALTRVLNALIKAKSWIKSHRAEAVQITAKDCGMDAKDLEPIFDRWTFDVELSDALVQAFDAQFKWATDAHLIKEGIKKPDYAKYFLADSLMKAQPAGVTYSH